MSARPAGEPDLERDYVEELLAAAPPLDDEQSQVVTAALREALAPRR